MEVNPKKSVFFYNRLSDDEKEVVSTIFGYLLEPQENGFKYLGFFLKPNFYIIVDWKWIVKRIDKNISSWDFNFLFPGGRITLVQVVLSSIPVYWFLLMIFTKSILNSIRSKVLIFCGEGKGGKYPFISLLWITFLFQKGWTVGA